MTKANTFIVEAQTEDGSWDKISTCCAYEFNGDPLRAKAAARRMANHLVEEKLATNTRVRSEAR